MTQSIPVRVRTSGLSDAGRNVYCKRCPEAGRLMRTLVCDARLELQRLAKQLPAVGYVWGRLAGPGAAFPSLTLVAYCPTYNVWLRNLEGPVPPQNIQTTYFISDTRPVQLNSSSTSIVERLIDQIHKTETFVLGSVTEDERMARFAQATAKLEVPHLPRAHPGDVRHSSTSCRVPLHV